MFPALPSSLLHSLASSCVAWGQGDHLTQFFLLSLSSAVPPVLLCSLPSLTGFFCLFYHCRVGERRCDFEGTRLWQGDGELFAGHVELWYWWTSPVSLLPLQDQNSSLWDGIQNDFSSSFSSSSCCFSGRHASGSRTAWSWRRKLIRSTIKRGRSPSRMPVRMIMACTTAAPKMQLGTSAVTPTTLLTL